MEGGAPMTDHLPSDRAELIVALAFLQRAAVRLAGREDAYLAALRARREATVDGKAIGYALEMFSIHNERAVWENRHRLGSALGHLCRNWKRLGGPELPRRAVRDAALAPLTSYDPPRSPEALAAIETVLGVIRAAGGVEALVREAQRHDSDGRGAETGRP